MRGCVCMFILLLIASRVHTVSRVHIGVPIFFGALGSQVRWRDTLPNKDDAAVTSRWEKDLTCFTQHTSAQLRILLPIQTAWCGDHCGYHSSNRGASRLLKHLALCLERPVTECVIHVFCERQCVLRYHLQLHSVQSPQFDRIWILVRQKHISPDEQTWSPFASYNHTRCLPSEDEA